MLDALSAIGWKAGGGVDLHWLLIPSVFLVAFLYSSVGHGGASGYLAILSLWAIPAQPMAASALILNLFVSSVALINFARAGHFSWPLAWPFMLLSVPFAWMGGSLRVSSGLYHWLLAGVLLVAAWRLWRKLPLTQGTGHPQLAIALPAGAGIGLLAGIVGVGGGIFLSPLLLLKRWADPKRAAATSAFFILANSAAGLLGRAVKGPLAIGPLFWLILAALLGGAIGSGLGANHFSGMFLKRILAFVLGIAALKAAAT